MVEVYIFTGTIAKEIIYVLKIILILQNNFNQY